MGKPLFLLRVLNDNVTVTTWIESSWWSANGNEFGQLCRNTHSHTHRSETICWMYVFVKPCLILSHYLVKHTYTSSTRVAWARVKEINCDFLCCLKDKKSGRQHLTKEFLQINKGKRDAMLASMCASFCLLDGNACSTGWCFEIFFTDLCVLENYEGFRIHGRMPNIFPKTQTSFSWTHHR